MTRIVPFSLALASGLATSGLLYAYLRLAPAHPRASLVPMVVSGPRVDGSHPLAPGDLVVVQVPQRPVGAYASPEELLGRLPLVPVPAGQPILASHLAPRGSQPGLWQRVPKGKRALAIAINEIAGVGGFLRPGLAVDVIGVAHEQLHWDCATVAQNVPILAVSQDDSPKPGEEHPKVASSATLLVSPEQAESISMACERGTVRLVLRGPDDHAIRKVKAPVWPVPLPPPTPGATPGLAAVPAAVPAAAGAARPNVPAPRASQRPAGNPVVEIIRGMVPEEAR